MIHNLICLPYAGAGASVYRELKGIAPQSLRVIPLQPSGREQRLREPLMASVEASALDLTTQATRALGAETRTSIFGHSLGAVLAYELARALLSLGLVVERLFVSGAPGPAEPRAEKAAALDDSEFLLKVNELAGYRHPALDDPDLRSLLMPILRADVAMHESYSQVGADRIDVPVTAIRGCEDTLVSNADLETWGAVTSSGFEACCLPGGHMYFSADFAPTLELIVDRVAR